MESSQVNVLFATSEVAPFSKTGGLADVSGSLPAALTRLGHRVTVVTPAYRQVKLRWSLEPVGEPFEIPIGGKLVECRLLRGTLPGTDVPVIFVDQAEYFDRPELYQENGRDYTDNCERFVFFCRAVMEIIRLLELRVDVLHCNDWQTGLLPAYLRIEYEHAQGYEDVVSLMTIHNMAYQGQFWHWDMLLTGLDWKFFNWRQMEFWGNLNLLKTGLVFADAIVTVSPRYAREIQEQPLGCGLEGVLHLRSDVVSGIINGIDETVWNPATDPHLKQPYSVADWQAGRAACKQDLQRQLGLAGAPQTPLLGFIGRLADQKGCDLLAAVIERWIPDVEAQWVLLGTGEPSYHKLFARLAEQRPDKVAVRLEFSDELAHRIEAGADMLLMPSRYEPCGLNQLYSLKYGAVPVVRHTGGLADTVCDASEEALAAGTATGFTFEPYAADALQRTLFRAVETFTSRPDTWRQLVETGMRQDWSWTHSARQYVQLYETLLAARAGGQQRVQQAH